MTKEKGSIDITNVKDHQAYGWIRELLIKSKDDSLNIKNEEYEAVLKLTEVLENKHNKYSSFYSFIKPRMTNKQKDDYIDHLEGV